MYVCICNGLKESIVSGAIESVSTASVSEVYRHLSCKPQCGKCLRDIAGMIEERIALGEKDASLAPAE
ncbi:MAG: (2Fe-2S)-binding protein [Pseudomonadota bacterium]